MRNLFRRVAYIHILFSQHTLGWPIVSHTASGISVQFICTCYLRFIMLSIQFALPQCPSWHPKRVLRRIWFRDAHFAHSRPYLSLTHANDIFLEILLRSRSHTREFPAAFSTKRIKYHFSLGVPMLIGPQFNENR